MVLPSHRRGRLFRSAVILLPWVMPVVPAAAQEVSLTAMTFFGANEQGSVNDALRWNTLYLDPAWDIAVFEWKDPATVDWATDLLNVPADLGVNLPLAVGQERTFGFTVFGVPGGWFGLNLFFDGRQDPSPGAPGISVYALTDEDGPGAPPAFNAIAPEVTTMGWPLSYAGGSGSLAYVNEALGVKVTMTDFVMYSPAGLGVDLVRAQEPGGLRLTETDGAADIIGSFTLAVEAVAQAPSGLVCTRSPDGTTVDLSWTNGGTYDSLSILRDGAEIATLPVASTTHRDTNVPMGTRTYRVLAGIDGTAAGPSCRVVDPAHGEANVTAMTFFATDDGGSVNPAQRWNTLYLDAAWDIAVFEGDAPPADDPPQWLNDNESYAVDLRLFEGEEKTFGFAVNGSNVPVSYFGLNLFFGGTQVPSPGAPGISVYAFMDDGTFAAIPPGVNTMGWPIADVGSPGILSFIDAEQGVKVTMTDFLVYSGDALGVDVGQPQEPGGVRFTAAVDGIPDIFGQFTLKVESAAKPPANLQCARSEDGATVDLSWTNDGTYSSLKVLRDRQEIATLAVSAASYRDSAVPAGSRSYQVVAEIKGVFAGPSCTVADPAHAEVFVTGLTFFGANDAGAVNPALRWNTLYLDAAWDIAVWEGEAPPAEEPPAWLNDPSNYAVNLGVVEGQERTFGFTVYGVPGGWFGLNLFFNGLQDPSPGDPGISVYALTDDDGPGSPPAFAAIPESSNTMGWPVSDVAGSGTLTFVDQAQGVKVTLTDFVLYSPDATGVDLVQAQEPGGRRLTDATDGAADILGQFTLRVEPVALAPTDLSCTRSADGKTVSLAWTNNGVYDSLKVFRDGAEHATLAASATSYVDSNVPVFTRSYKLVYGSNGEQDGPGCTVPDPANPEINLTALTFFGATEAGVVRPEERWNTNYLDGAWDIALYEGAPITDPDEYDPEDPDFWLNDPTNMSISIQFLAGQERTFSFHVGRNAEDANWMGMNFFFDGQQNPPGGTAGISVFALADADGPDVGENPTFQADPANPTMGWPIADIEGAGTLVYEDAEKAVRVILTDFVVFPQSAINEGAGIDLVQKQDPGGLLSIAASDGIGDFTGTFTLKVESTVPGGGFHRGDPNNDGTTNITDGIYILNYLFLGGPAPTCMESANVNDDAGLNITDGIYVLNYLFLGGPPPAAPGPVALPCGPDPVGSPTNLGCDVYTRC